MESTPILKKYTIIIIGVVILSVFSMRITRYFDLEKWQVSIGLIMLAGVLYILNNYLIKHFIEKNAPELASFDEVLPGIQAWELTTGTGIVPKWVSVIGLLAISALITAILPLIIVLISWVVALFANS